MLDIHDPLFPFVAASYGLTAMVAVIIFFYQRQCRRKANATLEMLKNADES